MHSKTSFGDGSGTGNLIVGWDDEPTGMQRDGDDNLVCGNTNNFPSDGCFVAGVGNTVSSPGCCVSGGVNNTASGGFTTVSGGANITESWGEGWAAGGATGTPVYEAH